MTPSDYTLGFVRRDGNMHDSARFGSDLEEALCALQAERATSDFHSIHWYVYDADDPERGYFDEVPEDVEAKRD